MRGSTTTRGFAILSQKMLHLLSGDVPQPTDGELRAYYDENRARYGRGATVTVEAVDVPAQLARRRGDVVLDSVPFRRGTGRPNAAYGGHAR